jgi:uncharacterized protein
VWDLQSSNALDHALNDYNFFYFDKHDFSDESEAQALHNAEQLFHDLDITIEIKNQACVHLECEVYFGFPYEALRSTQTGIGRFLVECPCVGISLGK